MEQIKTYVLTILAVFVSLSSIFVLVKTIKLVLDIKQKKLKNKINLNLGNRNNILEIKASEGNENKKNMKYRLEGEKVCKYDDGEIYKGEFINGKRNGFGICVFANKERYEGLWKEDKMHSIGKYMFNDGSVYSGDFKYGIIEGLGMHTYANKEIYKGYFRENKRNGKGALYYKDGSKYIGMWENDNMCGNGKLIKSNGDEYEGEFDSGKMNGKGTYKFANGCKYVGEFKNDVFHGHGCYTELNGDIYEGEYKYGCKRGKGILKTRFEGIYEGEFKDDLCEGRGRHVYIDNSIYDGDYKKGKRDGIGTYICSIYKYIGEWKEDRKENIGSYYLLSGAVIDVVINNNIIINGKYTLNDDEMYLYNVDINEGKESDVIENITDYLKKKENSAITIMTSNIYN